MQEYAITAAITVISTVFAIGVSYGVTNTMITHLKEQVKDLKDAVDDNGDTFVSKETFEAVTSSWQDTLKNLQRDMRDVKRMLIVSLRGEPNRPTD